MYRGIIFGLYRDSGIFNRHPYLCLAFLPLYFAVAHAHILYSQRHLSAADFRHAALMKLFQVSYTMLFGFYSAWIFTKSGCLWSAIALHSQCNYFGFPNFGVVLDWKTYLPKRILIGAMYLLGIVSFFGAKKIIY
jgi:prenyl protein peptidase